MPASGTWIAKIVQAERKAKRSLGFAEAQPIFAAEQQRKCKPGAKPNEVWALIASKTGCVSAIPERVRSWHSTCAVFAEAQPQPRLSRIPSRTCSRTVETQGLRRSQSSLRSSNSTILHSRSQCLAFHPILTRRRKCRGKLYSDTPSFLSYGWKMDSDLPVFVLPESALVAWIREPRSCLKFLAILKRLDFQGPGSGFCLPVGGYSGSRLSDARR